MFKTISLFALAIVAFAQAPPTPRVLIYGGAPTSGDCTLALAGLRVAIDTSTSPDTFHDCMEVGSSAVWVARPPALDIVGGAATLTDAGALVVISEAGKIGQLSSFTAFNDEQETGMSIKKVDAVIGWTVFDDGMESGASFAASNDAGTAGIPLRFNAGQISFDYLEGDTMLALKDPATNNGVVAEFAGRILLPLSTPASNSETCAEGTITADATYLYYCSAANTWKRKAWDAW